MIRATLIYFIIFLTVITAPSVIAETKTTTAIDSPKENTEPENQDSNEYLSPESLQWVDEKQKKMSSDVVKIGSYIDNFMGDTDTIQDTNKSYLKIYFDLDASEDDGLEIKPKVRFSLDLPITKKKLRLVIESDPDQDRSIEERNLSQLPSTNQEDSDGLYASFRYLFDSEKWQRLSFGWGVKAKWPPDPFARARAVRLWDLSNHWDMIYSQEIFWFETKGLGAYTQFDFDRTFEKSEDFLFRFTSALDWHERKEQFDLLEQVSLYQDIDDKRAIQYAVGFTGEHRKNHSIITNYYTKATYRRRLYKDWFFYELTPGIEFPREEDFKINPFISLRFEILFAEDASRKLTTKLY